MGLSGHFLVFREPENIGHYVKERNSIRSLEDMCLNSLYTVKVSLLTKINNYTTYLRKLTKLLEKKGVNLRAFC